MHGVELLDELAIITGLAVTVAVVLARLKIPVVAGLLVAGALAGPYGFGMVQSSDAIGVISEIGVVLLLFTIGLEFSLSRLKNILRSVALGGAGQVAVTTALAAVVAHAAGHPWGRSIFFGFVMALSSTAIVLKALAERRELDAPHGRFIVGTLIFQDLCVVPMVVIVPMLAAGARSDGVANQLLEAAFKASVIILATFVIARFVLPKIFAWVDASRSREMFLLAVITLCIGTAWLTSMAGLSLALGAFLGGMMVADTEYGHRAMGDVLPLKDAFVSIFFVSLGMLFDPVLVLTQPMVVGGLLAAFVLAKGLLATLVALAMKFPARVAWLAGVGLAQFGEFGFVLAKLGVSSGVATSEQVQLLLSAGIASMFLTPLLVRLAPHITAGERLLAPLERLIGVRAIDEVDEGPTGLSNHVVIVGYGLAGRSLALALQQSSVACLVLELNAETVRNAKGQGVALYYGDATSAEALRHAHLERARALVLLTNDASGVERIITSAKQVAPQCPILTRTRYLTDRKRLLQLGATEVVTEEVEGTIEIVVRLLRRLEIPRNLIDDNIRALRGDTGSAERKQTVPRSTLTDHAALEGLKVESVLLRDSTRAAHHSLRSLDLRAKTGALVIAVRRGESLLETVGPDDVLEPGDVLYLVGSSPATRAAASYLSERSTPS